MARAIKREVQFTTINAKAIKVVENEPKFIDIDPIIVVGELDTVKAKKHVETVVKDVDGVVITGVVTETKTYSMSFDKFMKNATVVETE